MAAYQAMYPHRTLHVVADIGGTHARIKNRTDKTAPQTFLISNNFNRDIAALIAIIRECRFAAEAEVASITLAVAGLVNAEGTGLRFAGNLTSWVGQDLVTVLQAAFGHDSQVLLVNNAQAAAYGEAYAAGYRKLPFNFVTWGTGLNAVHVTRDSHGKVMALQSEFGHTSLPSAADVRCACGQYGCAEAVLGGDRMLQRLNHGIYPSLERVAVDTAIRHGFIRDMAMFLRNVNQAHPCELIVLSGDVTANKPEWFAEISKELQALSVLPAPRLTLADRHEFAGLYGATQYSLQAFPPVDYTGSALAPTQYALQ